MRPSDILDRIGRRRHEPADPWQTLYQEAISGAELADSPVHGEEHWRAVAAVGLELNQLCPGTSRPLLLAFGMLHDCRRMDEGWDPEHGARAADVATNSRPLRDILTDQEIDRLAFACLWHEKGRVEREIHDVGLCWDSDRYNLVRLEITPIRELLSAPIDEDKHLAMIEKAELIWRNPPTWDDMVARVTADPSPERDLGDFAARP